MTIKIYKQDKEGNWQTLEIKETELLKYQNLGWTADKPATLGLGSGDDDEKKLVQILYYLKQNLMLKLLMVILL